jgi:hypothetical protein
LSLSNCIFSLIIYWNTEIFKEFNSQYVFWNLNCNYKVINSKWHNSNFDFLHPLKIRCASLNYLLEVINYVIWLSNSIYNFNYFK